MLKWIRNIFLGKKYGCSCNGDYEFVRKTSDNSYYKCSLCGAKDHLLVYRGGAVSVNRRMRDWYIKKSCRVYGGCNKEDT